MWDLLHDAEYPKLNILSFNIITSLWIFVDFREIKSCANTRGACNAREYPKLGISCHIFIFVLSAECLYIRK